MPTPAPVAAPDFATVRRACTDAGLVLRGAFACTARDRVPAARGSTAACLALVGGEGRRGFAAFRRSPEWGSGPHALDRFSQRVIGNLARDLGAWALYPHEGPPFHPFQGWARRAGALFPSPLGLLIHPRVGLWHAYRGALAFERVLAGIPAPEAAAISPCTTCSGQPCLDACPVAAFDARGFAVDACAAHLASRAGGACLDGGCLARNACPAGAHLRYGAQQRRFHMQAFARGAAQRGARGGTRAD